MAQSNDPGNFFQTTAYLEGAERKSAKSKNKHGNPIKLPSKILAITADPRDGNCVFVAEAAGTVKKIDLESSKVIQTFSGPTAPLTSVAVSPYSNTVFAGCWDKSIWSWDLKTRRPGKRFAHGGHSDFVKAVLVARVSGKEVLISGSADATIIVWDVESGDRLHTLKGHTRGVLALAIDPLEESTDSVVVFSAGSDREIRRWKIGLEKAEEIQDIEGSTTPEAIIAHETSIDALYFDTDGDLYTASADKTAKVLSRSQNFSPDTTLEHPDFVRDVVVDERGGYIITACRDEGVRVFDRGSGKLKICFDGHYEEVTGLVLLEARKCVVSVSIDGTIRSWGLQAQELEKAVTEAEERKKGVVKEEEVKGTKSGMTEEEERELAELMEDSE